MHGWIACSAAAWTGVAAASIINRCGHVAVGQLEREGDGGGRRGCDGSGADGVVDPGDGVGEADATLGGAVAVLPAEAPHS